MPVVCKWQNCLLVGSIAWVALNFYLAERLNDLLLQPTAGGSASSLDSPGVFSNGNEDEGRRPGGKPRRKTTQSAPANHIHSSSHYSFNRGLADDAMARLGRESIFQPLRAYVEKKLNDTVPGTVDKGNLDERKPKIQAGRPGKWYVPLPLREGSPDDLRMFEYGNRLKSCHDLPAQLPVDRGYGKHVARNVNNRDTFASGKLDIWEEARLGSPVNADPFLPWIHDMFPSRGGETIHFVAQNKRRCNSGKMHWADITNLEPQVTIMQPVSVERINEETATKIAPNLWNSETSNGSSGVRYRLAPLEEADSDGLFTRFICRFRAMDYTQSTPALVNVGETLSTYPLNYEFVNYRKDLGDLSMVTPKGKDNPMFWQSQFSFDCPVPDNGDLQSTIATGIGVLDDGTPSVYVDVVPIRTAPRYGKGMSYFTPDMAGVEVSPSRDIFGWSDLMTTNIVHTNSNQPSDEGHPPRRMKNGFDARLFWGDGHVLPKIEASGRWENLPICRHPGLGYSTPASDEDYSSGHQLLTKKHKLTACLWASATFTTRGNAQAVKDTASRLVEWIEFHLLTGWDHIYVYDNTGAHTDETSLESTLFPRFKDSEVTRIDWPCRVCNNNIPAHENTGERSSQYAAENSCRARYGPYTEWMASFDTDEYLIPMGDYESMRNVVDDAAGKGTNILTFKSTRAIPMRKFMEPFHDHKDCGSEKEPICLKVQEGNLFAEVYNCDYEKSPKPQWAERAKKQLYRSDYVLAHYVHYATVTGGTVQTKEEADRATVDWHQHFRESRASDRFTDEIKQAVMLHTKTTVPEYTTEWQERCLAGIKTAHGKDCRVGFPWPDNNDITPEKSTAEGHGYNCFMNEKLRDFWIPKLREAIDERSVRVEHLQNMNML